MGVKKIVLLMLCLTSILSTNQAQNKRLSLNDIVAKNIFATQSVRGLRSMNSGESYTTLENNGSEIKQYSYKTGLVTATIMNLNELKDSPITHINDYEFSADETKILLTANKKPIYRRSFTADYYIYDIKNKEIYRMSEQKGQRIATFSPTGHRIAFVSNNNIFIHDLRFKSERQITSDGELNHIINGAPDWVYEEEFSYNNAMDWSADGQALAYVKFNESNVKQFTMNMFQGLIPEHKENSNYVSNYTFKYPKAGEENSVVSVHVYDVNDRTTLKMDIGSETDIYIPRIKWTKDPKMLAIFRMNRLQNNFEILLTNSKIGSHKPLYRENNKRFVDETILDNVHFLDNGTQFVVMSEKNGYNHLYLYNMGGQEIKDLTPGKFDVIDFYGYDQTREYFYYSSYEASSIEKHIYSISTKGIKKQISTKTGWNDASFSKKFNYCINTVSSAQKAPTTTLYDYRNKQIRVLAENSKTETIAKEYQLPQKEFIQLPAADGKTMLNAWIMRPKNMKEGKTYPLIITQYSGPNSQSVKNNWSIGWEVLLAQEGFIVACIDPRGTGARGEEFRKCTYMQLGKIESDDIIAATKHLSTYKEVDAQNIGIWGWSYGGFMSSLCLMKGSDIFTTAIAVAPVTHFKYYDSIYTERYMRTPQDNQAGYNNNSPISWANKLEGNLLLCHGTADDNVHIQNTYELAEALVQAEKQFDMAIYTNRNHSIYGGKTRIQLYTKFLNYFNTHLK